MVSIHSLVISQRTTRKIISTNSIVECNIVSSCFAKKFKHCHFWIMHIVCGHGSMIRITPRVCSCLVVHSFNCHKTWYFYHICLSVRYEEETSKPSRIASIFWLRRRPIKFVGSTIRIRYRFYDNLKYCVIITSTASRWLRFQKQNSNSHFICVFNWNLKRKTNIIPRNYI